MPIRRPIPRPRHLFPQEAAVFIEGRRRSLRLMRQLRRAIGQVPVWTVGACSGLLGVMLAILLFFLPTAPREAAAVTTSPAVVVPPVIVDAPQIEPTLAEPAPTPVAETVFVPSRANLTTFWQRTQLPVVWDQEHVATWEAEAPAVSLAGLALLRDAWTTTLSSRPPVRRHQPYEGLIASVAEPRLTSQEFVSSAAGTSGRANLGVSVEKSAPAELVVGQPVTYQIHVRNLSASPLHSLIVRERVSAIHQIVDVSPPAAVMTDELVWSLPPFAGGELQTLHVTVVPDGQSDLQTETIVIPTSRAEAAVIVSSPPPPPAPPQREGAPQLQMSVTEIRELRQGDNLSLIFSVTNIGDAAARDVVLYVKLSGEFEHRYGAYVKHQFAFLAPGETRRALLQAVARDLGSGKLAASLTLQGLEKESRRLEIPIVARQKTPQTLPGGAPGPEPAPMRAAQRRGDQRWVGAQP